MKNMRHNFSKQLIQREWFRKYNILWYFLCDDLIANLFSLYSIHFSVQCNDDRQMTRIGLKTHKRLGILLFLIGWLFGLHFYVSENEIIEQFLSLSKIDIKTLGHTGRLTTSLCKLIWRHWTYKMPVTYIFSSVWVRLIMFSPLSIIQYVGLYAFSLPIFLAMIEKIYIRCLIIIIKWVVWTITHCVGLGHETMVSAVCLSIF